MLKTARRLLLPLLLCLWGVVAHAQHTASFYVASSMSTCTYKVVHFQSTSTPGYTSLKWDLGNGYVISTTSDTVSALYTTPGTYHVTLTAYWASDSATFTNDVVMPHNVDIAFTASDTTICPGTLVTFTNASSSVVPGAITYSWLIDGVTYTSTSPSYTFSDTGGGFYDVKLTATNASGCPEVLVKHGYIQVFHIPDADFMPGNFYICRHPFAMTFTGTPVGTGPFIYTWRFPSTGDIFVNAGSPFTYNYPVLHHANDVWLKVTDAHGCVDSIRKQINEDTLHARFVTGPTCVGSPVVFSDSGSYINTPTSTSWRFGDGVSRVSGHPDTVQHTYSSPGTDTVRFIVYDNHCRDTFSQVITVNAPPIADFHNAAVSLCGILPWRVPCFAL